VQKVEQLFHVGDGLVLEQLVVQHHGLPRVRDPRGGQFTPHQRQPRRKRLPLCENHSNLEKNMYSICGKKYLLHIFRESRLISFKRQVSNHIFMIQYLKTGIFLLFVTQL